MRKQRNSERSPAAGQPADTERRHQKFGWCGLTLFLLAGFALETFHGLKLGFYLDEDQTTRRLMWTLAHSHGALFSLVHIAWAFTLSRIPNQSEWELTWIGRCLTAGLILLPLGFFLGGLQTFGGDPGPGVLLVPIGALAMIAGVGITARAAMRRPK